MTYSYETSFRVEKKDWAKEKIVAEFGNDLDNLQVDTAKTAIQKAIDSMNGGKNMKDQYTEQGAGLVLAVQIMLRENGINVGKLDGIIGPKFKQAVIKFQKDSGFDTKEQDGQAGAKTLAKLISIESPASTSDTKAEKTTPEAEKTTPEAEKTTPEAEKTTETKSDNYITIGSQKIPIIDGYVTIDGKKYQNCADIDNFNGSGFERGHDDNIYYGERKDGETVGKVVAIFASGKKYIGEFEAKSPRGKGEMIRPSGVKYIGDFAGGDLEGKGEYTTKNNIKFNGYWKYSKLVYKVGGVRKEFTLKELDTFSTLEEFNNHIKSLKPAA